MTIVGFHMFRSQERDRFLARLCRLFDDQNQNARCIRFIPETYGGSGYANTFIIQPVIPINRNPDAFFPYHIVRPTFPILAPVADPFGPVPDLPGTGDTTVLDAYFHPTEKEGLTWGVGPLYVLPTASNPGLFTGERQTGLGEWQIGVAGAVINASRKDWVTGFLVQTYWSVESDAYTVQLQPILNRLNAIGDWYIGVGDLLLKFDDQNGNYNIPLNLRIGKVFTAGKQPINIFLQPEYTPRGLTSQPTSKYGIKLKSRSCCPEPSLVTAKRKPKSELVGADASDAPLQVMQGMN